MENNKYDDWQRCNSQVFWAEIAPTDHVVQFYDNDDIFINSLASFVGGGINLGECVIVIATGEHLDALEERLRRHGIHISSLIAEERYIPLDAEQTLAKFMVNDWPDEERFNQVVTTLFKRAQKKCAHVRAFGEMVALLWAKGHKNATFQLEHLWNKFMQKESFTLFCAYPTLGVTNDLGESMNHICCTHSKVIGGTDKNPFEISYQVVEQKEAV